MTTDLPPVWLYWEGPKPPLVALCIRSIQRHNPSTRLIGPADIAAMPASAEVRSITRPLTPAFRTNLLRVWLIWQHGGVWVDADTICTAPIELAPLAADHELVAVRNPGFAARETPLGGRAGSPIFAEAYRRYSHVMRTYRRQTPLNRLLRAHIPFPTDRSRSIELPDRPYYPFLYRNIPRMMCCRGRGLDPTAAVLWPINHIVYRRFASWSERDLMKSPTFLGQCLRHAFKDSA